MVIEERRWWFRTLLVLFDDEAALVNATSKRGSHIEAMSYNDLTLPQFSLTQEKKAGIIDLSGSLDEVLASFNTTAQKKISRTMRYEGFRFEAYDWPFPPEGYELYAAFERERGNVPFPLIRLRSCRLFLGYDQNAPVSGAFVYPTIPIARARSFFSRRRSVSDHEAYKRVSLASNRIIFEICRWAKESDRSGFDLGSVNTTEESKAGITNFKLSFNPRLVPEYTYSYSSPFYTVLENAIAAMRRVRRSFLH
jgi:hypothetical protein